MKIPTTSGGKEGTSRKIDRNQAKWTFDRKKRGEKRGGSAKEGRKAGVKQSNLFFQKSILYVGEGPQGKKDVAGELKRQDSRVT